MRLAGHIARMESDKWVQNFRRKIWMEETTWETLA